MANAVNTDQKRENLLNLFFKRIRRRAVRSESLETGFDREERTWELIVKYFVILVDCGTGHPGTGIVKWLWYTEGA